MMFTEMNDVEKREVRMYGCTVLEMKEAIEHRLDTRFDGSAALMARSMISDCQEMLAHDNDGCFDIMVVEDVRQMMNRVKYLLTWYVDVA
jgi:hypothetical protein